MIAITEPMPNTRCTEGATGAVSCKRIARHVYRIGGWLRLAVGIPTDGVIQPSLTHDEKNDGGWQSD